LIGIVFTYVTVTTGKISSFKDQLVYRPNWPILDCTTTTTTTTSGETTAGALKLQDWTLADGAVSLKR